MTLVHGGRSTVAPDAARPAPRPWRRAWDVPVWAHLAALAAVLVVLLPVVGTSQSFLADEGAAMIQARSLARGDGWIVEHPFPEVDPSGRHYPVGNADTGPRGSAPLAKHPLFSLLLAGADRLGGVTAMIALSLAGTVAAAALGAALARRLDPVLVRPTVWVVGLASPLLFDGYLAMAHTLGAALAAGAVLAAVVAIERRRAVLAVPVALCVAGAVLVRNEALLFAGALALAAGIVALCRTPRLPAAVVAAAAFGAAGAAHLVERWWVASIVGGRLQPAAAGVPAAGASLARGRFEGFVLTWLTPSYGGPPVVVLALLATALAVAVGALWTRSRPVDVARIRLAGLAAAGAATAAAVASVAWGPATAVPGLLVAFPVATAGMLVLRRPLFRHLPVVLAGATSALFAVAVLATQYPVGGTGEWGGRYFAVAIPVAVPVLLLGLHRQGLVLSAAARHRAAAALVVCSIALGVVAVGALRASHEAKGGLVAAVQRAGALGGGTGRPVVVTTLEPAPRLAWPTFESHRWLTSRPGDLDDLAARLAAAGVDHFVLVTADVRADLPHLGGLNVVSRETVDDTWRREVLVLRTP